MYVAVTGPGRDEPLIGSARLSVSSLRVEDVTLFKGENLLQRDNASDRVWPLLIAWREGHERRFLLGSRDVRGPAVTAWELFPDNSPKPVSDQSLLVSQVPPDVTADLIADFDPFVVKTWLLTPTKSLIYLANDSLYMFDATTMRFDVVFPRRRMER